MKNFIKDKKFSSRSFGRSQDSSRKFSREDAPRSSSKNFSRDDAQPRRNFDRFERRDSFEKRMHSVTCMKCGERCEVPFRPTEGKPVYCSACFRKNDNSKSSSQQNELDQINEKLDKILKILKSD